MKNTYILNHASISFDKKYTGDLPTGLLSTNNVYIIPTILFNQLKTLIKQDKYNSKTFIINYCELITELYKHNGIETSRRFYKSISNNYNQYFKLFSTLLFKNVKKGFYSETIVSTCSKYDLHTFTDLTFISIDDIHKDEPIINISNILNTPLNNPNYIDTLTNVKINAPKAILAEYNHSNGNMGQFIQRVASVLRFNNKRFAKKGDNVDRVYSSFSSISRISRPYIMYNSKYFIEIDIKNCQPLLLIILLINNNLKIDEKYINDTQAGSFYQNIIDLAAKKEIVKQYYFTDNTNLYFNSKDDIKKMLYSNIFFNDNIINTSFVELFNELYPQTLQSIKQLTNMACELQNLEADIILNIIPKCKYFTVHDAMYILNKTELEPIKKQIAKEIINRSGQLIQSVSFNINESKIENNVINSISNESIIINERTTHSAKEFRFNQFKELYLKYAPNIICTKLGISESTFLRYKKLINK